MPAAKRKKAFTHTEIKTFKCKEGKPYVDISEGAGRDKGFGIRVYASGVKIFFYKFRLEGKLKYMTLGEFPYPLERDNEVLETSLNNAVNKYKKARELVKKQIDPRKEEEPQSAPEPERGSEPADKGRSTTTFQEVINNYIDVRTRKGHSKKSLANTKWTLNTKPEDARSTANKDCTTVKPDEKWGGQAASSITVKEIIDFLKEYVERGVPGQALNIFKACRSAWEHAVSAQLIWEPNPFAKINLDHVLPELVPAPRERFLTNDEIVTVWNGLSSPPGSESVRRALQLVLVTAQRPGEVAGMHKSEISGNWWTIPKERTKYKKDSYRVYLTETALEIIGDRDGYIFPSPDNENAPISRGAMSDFVKNREGSDEWPKAKYYGIDSWQPRDLRRTVRTYLPELGVINEYAEQVLNHQKEKLVDTYNRYKYDAQKKEAMEKWEKRLLTVISVPTPPSPAPASSNKVLSDEELKIIWEGLSSNPAADATCRALKMILLTGQAPGQCAAMHGRDVIASGDAMWWKVNGCKVFLSKQALRLIGSSEGYAFASRDSHVKIGTLSYFILRSEGFGLPKWTPIDLQHAVADRIGKLGASRKVTEALRCGLTVNEWELRFWLEKWGEAISKIVTA